MSYDITQKVKVTNPTSNVDWYYGGDNGYWNSIAEALANVPKALRQIGKTVAVLENGSVTEYWWKSGIEDADLVLKFGYNSKITNEFNGDFENLGGVSSITIPESSHKMGLYPFVQCYLNGELALFDVTTNNGDVVVSWNNSVNITNNDIVSVRIVKPEQRFVYEQGEVNSFTIPAALHDCGEWPFVQVWLDGRLVIANVRNDNGDIVVSWDNDFTIESEMYVILTSNVYTGVFTNENDENSLVVEKNTHGKGDTPVIQCYLDNELVILDVNINNGDVTISWENSSEVSALKPLRFVITEQVADEQAITYDINDLVVIGEKNEGDGGITTTKNVGGVNSGVFFEKNTLLNELLRNILSPTLNPVLTAPYVSLSTQTEDRLFAVGSSTYITFSVDFDRGTINPAYGTNGKRSGVAVSFGVKCDSMLISSMNNVNIFGTWISLLDDEDKPTEGVITYRGVVICEDGEQPKNSMGANFDKPFTLKDENNNIVPLESDNSNSINFEFVYPIYANTDINHLDRLEQQPLVSKSKGYAVIDFPLQTRENRFTFAVASTLNVENIYYYNTVAQDWYGVNKIDDFDVVNDDSISDYITYKRYSMKGDDAKGEIKVKITWNV